MSKKKGQIKKFGNKTYGLSNRYSWSKARAKKRASKAKKKGYDVRVVEMRTAAKKKKAYALFVKLKKKSGKWKIDK